MDEASKRDAARELMMTFMPVAADYFQETGDPAPVNGLLKFWGEAYGMNVTDMLLSRARP
jgi:hypothetical protein